MDTPPEDSLHVGPPPGTLRALRDRAHSALAEQRKRMQQLETQLTEQLQMVAEELAAECGSDIQSGAKTPKENAAEAHESLQRERADWEAEQAVADAQMTQQMDELAAENVEMASREERLEAHEAEMNTRSEELADQIAVHDAQQVELDKERDEQRLQREALDHDHEELRRKQDEIAAEAERLELRHAEAESRESEQRDIEQQCDEQQREREALERDREELRVRQDELAAETERFEARRAEAADLRDERAADLQKQLDDKIAEHCEQLDRANKAFADLEELSAERDRLREELQSIAERVDRQERQADAIEESHHNAQEAWKKEREGLVEDLDRLVSALEKSGEKIDSSAEFEERAAEFSEIEKKFNLALDDLSTLRERNADLEQELARRPEQGASESSELVELRNERDDLAARIDELEKRPPVETDSHWADEIADLQRRFEMAVDDVRNIRKENEALVGELADSRRAAVTGEDTGAMDWESQKRRLLASLEDESEYLTADRVEERSTIESTLRITDDLVAKKDLDISELQQQLQAAVSAQLTEAEENPHREAIDADAAILVQREKLAALDEQMTDQLRKAEIELSIERAKIAREQAEIVDTRIELEALRGSLPKESEGATAGRGKWFSKLGLGGDE